MAGNLQPGAWNQFLQAIRPPGQERSVAKPYEFSGTVGEDAEEWLNHFNDCALANNWNPNRKLQVVRTYLTGAAGRWFRTLPGAIQWESGANTFEQRLLLKYITNHQEANWVQQLDQLKQGNLTVRDYVDEFQRLLAKVDPTNAWPMNMKVRKFIGGLTPQIAAQLYAAGINGLALNITQAERIEMGLQLAFQNFQQNNTVNEIEELR